MLKGSGRRRSSPKPPKRVQVAQTISVKPTPWASLFTLQLDIHPDVRVAVPDPEAYLGRLDARAKAVTYLGRIPTISLALT